MITALVSNFIVFIIVRIFDGVSFFSCIHKLVWGEKIYCDPILLITTAGIYDTLRINHLILKAHRFVNKDASKYKNVSKKCIAKQLHIYQTSGDFKNEKPYP